MNRFAEHWRLDPEFVYLNHGAYGACPRAVLRYQRELRDTIERQPVVFFEDRYFAMLDAARAGLARFIGAREDGLAAVPNATTGVNTVLRSLSVGAGDQLLVTDHAYNACRNALDDVARGARAEVRVVRIPFPVESPEQVVELVLSQVTERTTFALLDHVTSPTGLVLPVETLAQELERRGVAVLIDGAHAPGMLPLDVEASAASWYTGNGHKWICAPRGAAFLWIREDRRDAIQPLVISHGRNLRREGRSRFHDEFDWTGTGDPTAFLSFPSAIETIGGFVDGGWPEVRRRNRELVLQGRQILLEALDLSAPAPEQMIGSLAAIPLPDLDGFDRFGADPLQRTLRDKERIEVPIMGPPVSPCRVLRISAQLYNQLEHYERLAVALRRELR